MREVDTRNRQPAPMLPRCWVSASDRTVKAIAVMAPRETGWQFYLLLLRGDHSLNEVKVGKLDGLDGFPLRQRRRNPRHLNCPPGFIGPVGVDAASKCV